MAAETDDSLHASAVSVAGNGLLILGASGSGKSGLALRLMALGADLVADDRVSLRREGDALVASPPAALAGRIEARGIGILRVVHVHSAPIALAVDLDATPEARMPQPRTFTRAGLRIELISGRDVPNLAHALTTILKTGVVSTLTKGATEILAGKRSDVSGEFSPVTERPIVIMTGPGGSGRSTAIGALEDMGFEAIDNLPISFLPRLFAGEPPHRPVVIGVDPRNREFDVERLLAALIEIETATGIKPVTVYLECGAVTLARRYSETRRRHPMSPDGTPQIGIEREIALLAPLREAADVLIDTGGLTPRALRAEMARHFGEGGSAGDLAVSLMSFSYKRGTPRGADMIIDVRFLRNPHWDVDLRPLDGRDPAVADHIRADPNYAPFYERLTELLRFLLPAYRSEGKSYFGLGLGCTGGRHRSVMLVESLAKTLADEDWRVSIRHRDLDRGGAAPLEDRGMRSA